MQNALQVLAGPCSALKSSIMDSRSSPVLAGSNGAPAHFAKPTAKIRAFSTLQVITPSRLGGAEMLLVRLAPRLRARGHELRIVCNSSARGRADLRHALDEHDFALQTLPIGGKVNPRALASLYRAAKSSNAQFTHSHLSTASWWCGWLERAGGLPSLGHVQGFTSPIFHRHQKQLVACSQAVKEHLIEGGLDAARITVLPNPVAPNDIVPTRSAEEVRREWSVPKNAPLIGCFAGLLEKKGQRELLRAIPQVLAEHPTAQFWLVGQGPLQSEIEQTVRDLKIDSNVKLLGFRRDVADLMNAIDIMALPSHREPFGIVYVEAALLNKPCVACDAGGAPDVVRAGETGLLVPPRDVDSLAHALNELIGDRERAAQMGRNGREWVTQQFGWERFLPLLEEVYAKVVDG